MDKKKPFKAADGTTLMLIAFGAMLAMQFIISVVMMFMGGAGDYATEVLNFVAMFLFQAVYISVYAFYVKKKGLKSDYSPFNKISVVSLVAAPFLAIVCLFGFIGLAQLFDYLLSLTGFSSPELNASTPFTMVLMVVATVFVAPVCEETIFRNAFLSGANKVHKDALGPALLSGACFALMHINPAQTVYQFCLGAAIAYLVIKTGSVLVGMIMHSTSNAVALAIGYTAAGSAIEEFFGKVDSNILIMILSCLVFPAAAIAIVWIASKLLNRLEREKYPAKFGKKPIWIDEETLEPVFEGEDAPVVTEKNRYVRKGNSPMTGTPLIEDRLERQRYLMEEYEKKGDDTAKRYKTTLVIYFVASGIMWLLTFVSSLLAASLDI